MIPSRGLLLPGRAIGMSRQRLRTVSQRSLSASTAFKHSSGIVPKALGGVALGARTYRRPQILRISSILGNGLAVRFASTKDTLPDTTTPPAPSTTPLSSADSSLPDWALKASDINLENAIDGIDATSYLDIPERIGYLKEMGLDFGWGPTSFVEFILEHVHVWSGMPWWASIIGTSLIIRVVFFKLFQNASDNAARLATVAPISKPLQQKMKEATARNETQEAMRLRLELSRIHARAGIKLWKSFAPFATVFTGYGTFIILRAMAKLPVPGLEDGGLLWFQNLTIADPTFILPIATSTMLYYAIKKGGENGVNTMQASTMRVMSYALPGISFAFTAWFPASVQLSFLFTSIFSNIQAIIFRTPAYRKWVGMAPLPTVAGSSSPGAQNPSNPRIITVKPKSEGLWEAPRENSEQEPNPPSQPTILGGLRKNAAGAVNSVKKTTKDAMKSASEAMGTSERARAAERKQAAKIEGLRRSEEAQKRAALDREKKERRRARKFGGAD